MQSSRKSAVESIFERTLQMRESVASGSTTKLVTTRNELRELLDRVRCDESYEDRPRNPDYFGLSYPLACWIDEVMTADAVVGTIWNECKLEGLLFGTNDRAWMFWRQAELAEALGRHDDLAIFYLCVSLGFTGQFSNDPQRLVAWMHRKRFTLGMVPELRLPFANDLAPSTDVPPLMGTKRLRRAIHVAWASAVLLLPVMSYLLVTTWNR